MSIQLVVEHEELPSEIGGGSTVKQHMIVIDHVTSWEAFQKLVHRAANLWPDAPAEIKEFADKVTIGHVQQVYADSTREHFVHYHKCPHCSQVNGFQTANRQPPEYPVKCEKLVRAVHSEKTLEDGSIQVIYREVLCGHHAYFNPAQ